MGLTVNEMKSIRERLSTLRLDGSFDVVKAMLQGVDLVMGLLQNEYMEKSDGGGSEVGSEVEGLSGAGEQRGSERPAAGSGSSAGEPAINGSGRTKNQKRTQTVNV